MSQQELRHLSDSDDFVFAIEYRLQVIIAQYVLYILRILQIKDLEIRYIAPTQESDKKLTNRPRNHQKQ